MASLASHKSPDRSIPLLKKIITGTLSYDDQTFTYTIYPNPHKQDTKIKNKLIEVFGNRIQKGQKGQKDQKCLGITEDIVKEYIKNEQYTALIHIKNNNTDDSATGALQYWDWCEAGVKQLWISDLCRVNNTNSRSNISPISVLFDIIKNFSIEKGITENYLMVEREKPGTEKLLEIYGKYGFKKVDSCVVENMIAMKKSLLSNNNNNNNNNSLINKIKNLSIKSGGKKLRHTQKKKKV
jgi:hypothetical protein